MFVTNMNEDALTQYSKRLEEAKEFNKRGFHSLSGRSVALNSKTGVAEAAPQPQTQTHLLRDLGKDIATSVAVPGNVPNKLLCRHCKLPLNAMSFMTGDGVGKTHEGMIHSQCLAQSMLVALRNEEDQRKQKQAELKKSRRAEFDIGWCPETIPRNAASAQKLACEVIPQGMCCLASGEDGSLQVASTLEPAAAINLEYLSVALQVRRSEGREPLFSLDPVENGKLDQEDPDASMQVKRFEPEWLAGTSVGEVMFQADYHLKELSFGEYEQPVVGMKSCFDYSEGDSEDSEWSAREWFVVRKAEIHTSDDQVLIPHLKMGVEAREQIMGADGLEDAAITRPDHPLVKYADTFTHNFDLIAERKSVVYQLREVAKASIMAKFLLESGVALGDAWFSFAETVAEPACCLEVPQLWNDRCSNNISLKNGTIDCGEKMHGLYGGVDFGIDRFRLSAPSRVATSVVAGRAVLGRPASSLMATTRTGLSMGPARQFARLSTPLSATMSMAATRAGLGVPQVAAGLSMGAPQGVDLNLDKFNLSATAAADGRYGSSVQVNDTDASLSSAFWTGLSKGGVIADDSRELLNSVFNPHLSDRRSEGDLFTPPPTNVVYMGKLKELVKAEQAVQQRRKAHFFSTEFAIDKAGALFSSSWTSSFQVTSAQLEAKLPTLQARPEYLAEASVLREALASNAAIFNKHAEDGTRFRIYRLGGLEVRSVQELEGDETIGMVFSVCPAVP